MSSASRPLEAARRLSRVLDDLVRVPGTHMSFGLDPVLNVIPVAGDAVTALMSATLLITALRMRVPMRVVVRMIINIAIDALVGAIPGIGHIFDFFWKANARNLALLEAYAQEPDAVTAESGRVALAVVVSVALFVLALIACSVYVAYILFALASEWLERI